MKVLEEKRREIEAIVSSVELCDFNLTGVELNILLGIGDNCIANDFSESKKIEVHNAVLITRLRSALIIQKPEDDLFVFVGMTRQEVRILLTWIEAILPTIMADKEQREKSLIVRELRLEIKELLSVVVISEN